MIVFLPPTSTDDESDGEDERVDRDELSTTATNEVLSNEDRDVPFERSLIASELDARRALHRKKSKQRNLTARMEDVRSVLAANLRKRCSGDSSDSDPSLPTEISFPATGSSKKARI